MPTYPPPLLLGTATFNYQYVSDPLNPEILPALSIVTRTLELGISAFDTSPYYGPSEQILGAALSHPSNAAQYPRSSYFLVTKAGRIGPSEFDYSPEWIRYSVYRSLERLGGGAGGSAGHLDLVYLHDAEFVTPREVLGAIRELRRLRDEEGVIRYVGISGYPVTALCDLAALVASETGEPLDAVLSYGHFTIQNTTLSTSAVQRFEAAGVDVVLNASMLGMGLLTTRGADAGPMASWHPSPEGLRKAVRSLVGLAQAEGEKLEVVAIRWAMDNWAREGASKGGSSPYLPKGTRVGVNVMGVATVAELEETYRVFRSVIEGYNPAADASATDNKELAQAHDWSLERRDKIQKLVERMWEALGAEWKDYSWSSPDPGFVNTRKKEEMGVVPQDDGITEKYSKKKQVR
ncbi:L-galactose dehydrogenase [Apiospora aurea]|uniref:L-galactose dehydrogenase n=1 Tax=Apiospora aurea TaxID=335848 RepID=A0ABR1QNM1_9PEZI